MHIDAYLDRIGHSSAISPAIDNLRALQRNHLLMVPFENLDIHLGRRISLDRAALHEKIVSSRRGGFCYELNSLFAFLLTDLGYDVTHLSARDARPDGSFGPEFDHLTLVVSTKPSGGHENGRLDSPLDAAPAWLVDVGWGDTFMEPLELKFDRVQQQGERAFRIERIGRGGLLWQRTREGRWKRDFQFSLIPRRLSDFFEMCAYQQSSPASRWTRERLCTIATPSGRVTLRDSRLVVTQEGVREEQMIDSPAEYAKTLRQQFGIRLGVRHCARWF
jgi:N-hydroxyarylamine O-acetyltransferase